MNTQTSNNSTTCKYWDDKHGYTHWCIEDYVDINPDRSCKIFYCKKCEMSMNEHDKNSNTIKRFCQVSGWLRYANYR